MRTVQLQAAVTAFVEQAAACLHAEVLDGQEVPFELEARGGRASASLYCYRPLTDTFVAERMPQLRRLPAYPDAVAQLTGAPTLERYLLARGVEAPRKAERHADAVLLALLQDVFAEQTDFDPSRLAQQPERLARALERLDGAALTGAGEVTVLATLHGLAIASPQVALARGLSLSQPDALSGAPEQALRAGSPDRGHLLVLHTTTDAATGAEGAAEGVAVVRELLAALRLFGDGRIALGARAWARVGDGRWSTLALGPGGHPHGMLVITAEQEDELRAFCALIARRAPSDGPIAWALRRFELGCDRADEYEALSDHLLALRALLAPALEHSPAGTADGLLAARLAALCAVPDRRRELCERLLAAIALERDCIAGTAVPRAAGLALARELADHLRALLRDVVCGHLSPELAAVADEILLAEQDADALDGEAARGGTDGEGSRAERYQWREGLADRGGQPQDARVKVRGGELPAHVAAGSGGELTSHAAAGGELPTRAPAGAGEPAQLALGEQDLADGGDPGEILGVAV